MKISTVRLITIIVAYVLAYYVGIFFGMGYGLIFPKSLGGGSLIPLDATQWFRGIPLSLIFFVVFSLNFLGGRNKWWWVSVALVPAILFEVLIDPLHLYVPIILGVIAWWLGTMANKGLQKIVPGFMSKIS